MRKAHGTSAFIEISAGAGTDVTKAAGSLPGVYFASLELQPRRLAEGRSREADARNAGKGASNRAIPHRRTTARDRGTPFAPTRRVSEKLKRRIHEYGRRDRRNAFFAERLLDLTERIERDFEGEERDRLLAKARDAFDRHVQLRDQTNSVRDVLARLRDDQKRLLELFELITPRPEGELLH
jgi:hypothetical protein